MELNCIIFVLCCLALVGKIEAFGTAMGPMGKLVLNSLYECKDDQKPTGDDILAYAKLRRIGDKDDKEVYGNATIKIAFDDNINYIIDIKKFENGWKNVYNVKGKLCHDINLYIKRLWAKLTASAKPAPDKSCPIPPGFYNLEGFQALAEDIEYKTIFYGRLMVTISLVDKKNKILFCRIAEGDSQAPH